MMILLILSSNPLHIFLADKDRMVVYHDRLKKKDWQKKWPRLQILA